MDALSLANEGHVFLSPHVYVVGPCRWIKKKASSGSCRQLTVHRRWCCARYYSTSSPVVNDGVFGFVFSSWLLLVACFTSGSKPVMTCVTRPDIQGERKKKKKDFDRLLAITQQRRPKEINSPDQIFPHKEHHQSGGPKRLASGARGSWSVQ
ncbi:hypothetical protein VTN02DRAFT_293 [Thermoascus thermophilus]